MSIEIVHVPLAELHPYENNPRNNEAAVEKVACSIQTFGFLVPIVAKPDGEILAGHTRYAASLRLGLKEVPVIYAADLTEAKAKAFRLADNKVAEAAEWDVDKLKAELEDLAGVDGLNLDDMGFDLSDLDVPGGTEGETEEDSVPEETEGLHSEPGRIYALGDHRLACGSSADAELVARLMAGEQARCIFTDPPYGVSVGSKNKVLNEQDGGHRRGVEIENDTLRNGALKDFLVSCFAPMVEVAAAEDCSFYIFSPPGDELTIQFLLAMQESGLPLRHCLEWVKNNATFSMRRLDYDYQHEPIHFTWRNRHIKNAEDGGVKTSCWFFDKPMQSKLHPTMKPVGMYEVAYKNSSRHGDIVYEPFGGSGTAFIAAEKTGRKCRAVELDRHYCDVIRKRWAEFVHGEGCDWEELTPEVAE